MPLESLAKIFTEQANSQPLAFVIALVISFLITPLIRARALESGLKREDKGRKAIDPTKNAPRLGGIAILISILVTIVFYLAVFGRYTPRGINHLELEGIATAAMIIFFVGLLDDLKPLPALAKLFGQVTAASIAWLMQVRIEFLANPLYYIDHAQPSTIDLGDLSSYIATVVFLVLVTNAVNLIDGIDGLAVGFCLIASIATWAINMSPLLNQPAGAILAATMAGACLGFLRYNFNPARIFLGDNGAYLLGFVVACLSCIGLVKKVTVVLISPIVLLILLVPICDTCFAIFRRAVKQKPIMKPDLEHLHHKLLELGLSEKQVNYLLYSVTFAGGLLGTYLLGQDIALNYLVISLSIIGLWLFFSLVLNIKRQKDPA